MRIGLCSAVVGNPIMDRVTVAIDCQIEESVMNDSGHGVLMVHSETTRW